MTDHPDTPEAEDEDVVLAMVPLPGDGWYSVKVEHQVDKDQEGHPAQTWEVRAEDGSVRVEPMGHAEPADVSDTPEPPEDAPSCGHCFHPVSHYAWCTNPTPATPEGGQPDPPPQTSMILDMETGLDQRSAEWQARQALGGQPDTDAIDRLFETQRRKAEASAQPDTDDELLARAEKGTAGLSAKRIAALVADLASALRRKREDYDRVIGQSRTRGQSITRLERELAEARSHGEVLARKTTDEYGWLAGVWLHDVPPGTEVLVVRATADQEETDGE